MELNFGLLQKKIFIIIDKSLVDHAITTGGRIVSGEIPISGMTGQHFAKIFDGLVNDTDLNVLVQVFGTYQITDLGGNFLLAEAGVNPFDMIGLL